MNKFYAFLKKDLRLALSYKMNFVMIFISPIISMLLLFMILKSISTINESNLDLALFSDIYFGIVLIDLSFVVISSLPHLINEYRQQGILEEILYKNEWHIIFSTFSWILFIFIFKTLVYLLIASLLFGTKLLQGMLFLKIISILTPTFIALMGLSIISASYSIINLKSNLLQTMVMTASSFLSGAFFSISLLPSFLIPFTQVIPITHSLHLIRNINEPLLYSNYNYLILIFLGLLFNIIGYSLIQKSISKAKKDGLLIYF